MKYDHRFVLLESGPSMRIYGADGVRMRVLREVSFLK